MVDSYSDYLLDFAGQQERRKRKAEDEEKARVKGTEEQELNRQISRQMQELELRGAKPKLNPVLSTIGRVGDLLSRGNYAVAEMFDRSVESEKAGQSIAAQLVAGAQGFGGGITGKDKTTWHDNLKEHGLPFHRTPMKEGKPTAALGFALDILLDPTTYASMGSSAVAKGAGEGALKGIAAKIGEDAAETVVESSTKKIAQEVVESAAKRGSQREVRASAKLADKTASGRAMQNALDLSKPKRNRLIKNLQKEGFLAGDSEVLEKAPKFASEVIKDHAVEQGKKAGDLVKEATQGSFGLKILGKEVVGSTKLYAAGEAAKEAVLKNVFGEELYKKFSTRSLFPGPLTTLRREAEGWSVSHAEDAFREIDRTFRSVSKPDQRRIRHAIENDVDLSKEMTDREIKRQVPVLDEDGAPVLDRFDRPKMRTVKEKVNMQELKQKAVGILDEYRREGEIAGTIDPKEVLDNYVYHFYRGGDNATIAAFKKNRRQVLNPLLKTPKNAGPTTIEAAKAAGLNPVEEIGDILKLYTGKYYKERGRAIYANAIGQEFGVQLGKDGAKLSKELDLVKTKSKYLKGVDSKGTVTYLPERVEKSIKAMDGLYDNADEASKFLRLFDKSLAAWKFSQTAPNPGHHIRNLIGDIHNNWLDGVDNPYRYKQAWQVLHEGNRKHEIRIGNKKVSAEQILDLYKDHGVKSGYTRVEIGARRFRPSEKLMELSENREDFGRMAHFIDSLKKEAEGIDLLDDYGDKKLKEVASRAAGRVREYNIDYGDLTDFEKKYMKRIIPFYTWNRKNIPLQLKALALHPGRMAVMPKALRDLRDFSGFNYEDGEYPTIGGLQTVPKWLRDIEGIQILGEGQGRHGVYYDPTVALPSLGAAEFLHKPLDKLIAGHPGGAANEAALEGLNQSNPLIRMLIEGATGKNLFTGAKKESGPASELSAHNPLLRNIIKQAKGEATKWDWTNYLAGTSFRNIGEQQTLGEYRRQQDILEGQLKGTGGRAAAMLAGSPLEEYDPRTVGGDEEDVIRAKERLLGEMTDLEAGGEGLALLKMKERLAKANQKAINSSRVNQILFSYYMDDPSYQAFTTTGT